MTFLSNLEKDKLTEVVNIGAGNASTALSQIIHKTVNIKVPETFVGPIEKVHQFFGESEEIMTAILLKILGDAPGVMLLMFPPKNAMILAGFLTQGHKKDLKVLDELDRSALREVGNILAGASLTALSKFLNMNILQSVPETATDMLGAVMETILSEIGKKSETVLVFKVDFKIEGDSVSGNLFFIFDPQATTKILDATKRKIKEAPHV